MEKICTALILMIFKSKKVMSLLCKVFNLNSQVKIYNWIKITLKKNIIL